MFLLRRRGWSEAVRARPTGEALYEPSMHEGKAAATPFAFLWHGHTRPLAAKPYKKRKDIQQHPT